MVYIKRNYTATAQQPTAIGTSQPKSQPAQTALPIIKLEHGTKSEELASELPPGRPLGVGGALGVDGVPVDLAAAGVDVDLRQSLPGRALPDPADEVEGQDDEEGEVGFEEALGVEGLDGGVELGILVSYGSFFPSYGLKNLL